MSDFEASREPREKADERIGVFKKSAEFSNVLEKLHQRQ
jgi:hypothetical protein